MTASAVPRACAPRASSAQKSRLASVSTGPVRFRTLKDADRHRLDSPAIVVNAGTEPVRVREDPQSTIAPLHSAVLSGVTLERSGLLLLLEDDADRPIDQIIEEPGWFRLGELLADPHVTGGLPFPPQTPLWRGPRELVGSVRFDPGLLLGGAPSGAELFDVWANLWFAPAGTDCFIHRLHDFVEVHTQVAGVGRMQKFTDQDPATLYHDIPMAPGHTTAEPFCARTAEGALRYPWHQYRADTDCVWLAIEYHPETP